MSPHHPLLAAALGLALALPGCATNPVSGRPELVFMSREKEIELGEEAAKQVAEQVGLLNEESELVTYIRELGATVASLSPRQDVEYTFNVADMVEPNAFALPGGPVYVSRGLLPLFNSEDELVNVLAHEVGHVAGRHHVRGDARRKTMALPAALGTIAAAATLGQGGAYLASASAQGLIAAHSRDQESEADEVGQKIAARAGWDPLGMSGFLNTLDRTNVLEHGEAQQGSFFATHPAAGERVGLTRERAGELQREPAETLDRPTFLAKLRGVVIGEDPKGGTLADNNNFLHVDLGFRIRFPEDWFVVNAPSFVGAHEGDGAAQIKLELQQTETGDPKVAAQEFLAEEKRKLAEAEEKGEKVGELPDIKRTGRREFYGRQAYLLEASVAQGQGTIAIYWVPIREYMFRLTCAMATPLWERGYRRDCRATARSLRRIKRKERAQVKLVRLDFAPARANETLAAFNERTKNDWTLEETAVANGLEQDATLTEGQLVKIAVSSTYEPKKEE